MNGKKGRKISLLKSKFFASLEKYSTTENQFIFYFVAYCFCILKIIDVKEIDCLTNLYLLRHLNLNHNPIRDTTDYRLFIIFKLPQLTVLDTNRVDVAEKVNATNTFNPSIEYIAARDHMTNLVFSYIQDHRVKERYIVCLDLIY